MDNGAPLLNHAMARAITGGVGSNRDVTLASRGTVESTKEDWQNGKTYES